MDAIRLVKPPLDIPPIVEVMQWHSFRKEDRGLDWFRRALSEAGLRDLAERLEEGRAAAAFDFDPRQAAAPLPRSPNGVTARRS